MTGVLTRTGRHLPTLSSAMVETAGHDFRQSSGPEFAFGPFRLLAQPRELRCGEKTVRLGSRAREILLVLVEQAGRIVRKSDLMARVWPGIVVGEGTLRVHIAALRKVLGAGQADARYVENVAGHGYRFVAPVAAEALSYPAVKLFAECAAANAATFELRQLRPQ
jgi:DNA-binding winged helix-turn-helix (wHTH) protein